MMEGISKFNPIPLYGPHAPPSEDPLKAITDRINSAIESIRAWQTIMNIMGYQAWDDPITEDFHIVLKHGKLVKAEHIGEAAEKVK